MNSENQEKIVPLEHCDDVFFFILLDVDTGKPKQLAMYLYAFSTLEHACDFLIMFPSGEYHQQKISKRELGMYYPDYRGALLDYSVDSDNYTLIEF